MTTHLMIYDGAGHWTCPICSRSVLWDPDVDPTPLTLYEGDTSVQHSGVTGGIEFGGLRVDQAAEDDITLTDLQDERLEPFRKWMDGRDG